MSIQEKIERYVQARIRHSESSEASGDELRAAYAALSRGLPPIGTTIWYSLPSGLRVRATFDKVELTNGEGLVATLSTSEVRKLWDTLVEIPTPLV
jgi:hypothetical protein